MPIYGWPRYALANYSLHNHLSFCSFILRYCAHYSFRGSPLFLNYSQLRKYRVHAVLSGVQYKNDVKFLIQTHFDNLCKQSCVLVHMSVMSRGHPLQELFSQHLQCPFAVAIQLQIVICQQRKCHNAIIPGNCAYYFQTILQY